MTGAMKLQSYDGPRSSLGIGPRFGRCSGISSKFAKRFVEGIGKLARNTLGDHRKKIGRLAARMSEVAGLVGRVNRPYPDIRAVEPPRSTGFDLHPKKIGRRRWCALRRRTWEWT
ncbi:hypothetical protein B296_00020971 [Ensete ventricosum]|uniref:Uncharacterized protein n=1 Tax=Ensete ventricosum TaxID=4639 RepID=A0A426YC03_ENSVE|nr:hypothetical protein B296_00020971 [Ensete ventricosum]